MQESNLELTLAELTQQHEKSVLKLTLPELEQQHKHLDKEIMKLSRTSAVESLEMKRLKTAKAFIKNEIVKRGGITAGMVRDAAALQRNKMEQAIPAPVPILVSAQSEVPVTKKSSSINGSPGRPAARYDDVVVSSLVAVAR
jgi:hypothetical protein